jgi:hypothetical protein
MPSEQEIMAATLAAIAQGAQTPPVVGANGAAPATPPHGLPVPALEPAGAAAPAQLAAQQLAAAQAAQAHAAQQAPQQQLPSIEVPPADRPIPGDTTALSAQLAVLEAELARSRKRATTCAMMTLIVSGAFVLLVIYTRAPDAIPGGRTPVAVD